MSAIAPIPRTPIAIRVATADDLAFIDALQKRHTLVEREALKCKL